MCIRDSQHRAVMIIFPLKFQTITITRTLFSWGEGGWNSARHLCSINRTTLIGDYQPLAKLAKEQESLNIIFISICGTTHGSTLWNLFLVPRKFVITKLDGPNVLCHPAQWNISMPCMLIWCYRIARKSKRWHEKHTLTNIKKSNKIFTICPYVSQYYSVAHIHVSAVR